MKNSNPEKDKFSQKISEVNSLTTNASQGSVSTEKKEKKEAKEKDSNNNFNAKEVNTPGQNAKPIIFEKKENPNLKNILDINKAADPKLEKKNYHYEKKQSKNESEEKKENKPIVNNAVGERKKSAMNPAEIVETNRVNNKDRKKEGSKDMQTPSGNNFMPANNANVDIKKPNVFNSNFLNNANNNTPVSNPVNDKKKLSGNNISANNVGSKNDNIVLKEPPNEKKRSDSKSSQEDKNSYRKKDPGQLKDFLKNMRDKMKNSPVVKEPTNGVQWGVKETEIFSNFSPNNNNVQIGYQQRKDSNNNSKEKFSNFMNMQKDVGSNEDNPTDLKDYLATHKMLIELEKIQNDDSIDQNEKEKVEINTDELNDSVLREMNMMNFKEGFNIEGEARDEFNIDDQINCKYNFEDLCEQGDKKPIEKLEKADIQPIINFTSDNMFEMIKFELESEFDKQTLEKLFKIVDEKTKSNMVSFDSEALNQAVYEEFGIKGDNGKVDNLINRIPDVFTLIIRDRGL